MNRKQRRAMKKEFGEEAVNKMESVEKAISNMSNKCSKCDAIFDKDDKSLLDAWRVSIDESGFKLVCPSCVEKEA
tara:strand:+ start:477 stop:701 length:225 start_codon:yes stop_codon:yes gene_type:complete